MTRPPPLLAFSDDCAGLAVSFAVFDFGRQLLVWAAPEGRDETLLGALALYAWQHWPQVTTFLQSLGHGVDDLLQPAGSAPGTKT